jgi:hypothetical protein
MADGDVGSLETGSPGVATAEPLVVNSARLCAVAGTERRCGVGTPEAAPGSLPVVVDPGELSDLMVRTRCGVPGDSRSDGRGPDGLGS